MSGPDPNTLFPISGQRRVCFLKPLIKRANIEVGDFTYYDDADSPLTFAQNCVLYHYEHVGDKLIIGRFTAIGPQVRFIMNGAAHVMRGISTYPFELFDGSWAKDLATVADYRAVFRGDTVVGNDVWIGREAMILPGVTIGDGAVIGARSVVARDVPPYAVAAGNPARVKRMRYNEADVARLLRIAWWNWEVEKITSNLDLIRGADIDALERASDQRPNR
jgi:virginiamycin A acetyltransferase